jgi:hypothetical protein
LTAGVLTALNLSMAVHHGKINMRAVSGGVLKIFVCNPFKDMSFLKP